MRTNFQCLWLVTLVACGSGQVPDETLTLKPTNPAPNAETSLRVEPSGTPTIAWDASRGTTTVVARWIARRADGTPLGPNDVDVALNLNGRGLDPEVILQQGAQQLGVNLTYGMVLDATYSMMLHTPPAFGPMTEAAQKSVQTGEALWRDKPGSYTWTVAWFDDYVYRPETPWADSALLSIPAPSQGAFTRLYSAVDFGLSELSRVRATTTSGSQQDVLVVFSDGRDNHSAWTPPDTNDLVQRDNGLSYRKLSWPGTALNTLLAKIQGLPNLTVHTLGMGTDVNDAELQAIADAGRGIYVKNPNSSGVGALFERVTQEFTTLQSSGASLLNAPGDYVFSVTVTDHATGTQGTLAFNVHLGDEKARVLSGG